MGLEQRAQAPGLRLAGGRGRQARALFDEALDRMAPDLRAVFVLFELEQLEVKQIAEIEEIPVGTASSRLRRAREEFSAIARRIRSELAARGEGR